MNSLEQYLVPYLISQLVSVIFLIVAWKRTKWARVLFALLFFWAAGTNMYIGITKPDTYQLYADLAIPVYSDFINGWFSRHNHIVIPLIAIGQFLIAFGMLLRGWWITAVCLGAIIFLLSIAPLMVGAAFPFSITVSIAAWLILLNDDKSFIWQKRQNHLSISKRIPVSDNN
ncbi:MAG TPA: hypothetical protein VFT15_16615 [Chitinophagaceae bacterium]|nr:hypothetical protein [Chitinophagaceae bacterium]